MAQIMIVEDNQGTNKAICEYLKTAGHTLFPALDGEEALNIFRDNSIDLAVLDIMLPKMSGVTILHEIRKISNIPVVMLTAVDDEYTQSNSFDELADDYITKPFSMLILGKRITALLRRSENKSTVSTIRLGNVTVDFAGYTAHDENGKIDITPKELEILKVLIENKGLVLSRNQILDDVWGYDCDVIDRTIDAYIRNIRKKLRLDCITTVKGIGYKFEMENHYENKAILKNICIYIRNDASNHRFGSCTDFYDCSIGKCPYHKHNGHKRRCACVFRSGYAAAHNADNPKVISAFICLLHGNFAGFFVFVLQRNNGPDIVYLNVCPSNVKVGSYRRDLRDLHRRNRRIS